MVIPADEVQKGLQDFYDSEETGQAGSQVSHVTLLGSGFETDVYAFSLESGEKSVEETEDLILRLYAGEGTAEKSAREFAAMSRLREAGYPVPKVHVLHREPSPFGRPFLIMERIPGASLERSFWSAEEDRRQDVQVLFYRLMAQLHALKGSDILPDSPLATSRDPYGFVDYEFSLLSELLHRLDGQEPPSLRDALTWLRARREIVPCERFCVVHGDFHRNNVLLRADGAAFVIDWSNVRLGDPRTDLAWTRLLTRAEDLPDGGESELHLYEQFAGRSVTNIAYFEVVACTRLLSSVLISLRFGAARQGMRPEAEALMRREVAHTRFVVTLLQKRTGLKMPDIEDALTALQG